MNPGNILKIIFFATHLCENLGQIYTPRIYKVIDEGDSVSNGWSLISQDHPLLSNNEFLNYIHDGDDDNPVINSIWRVIVKDGHINVRVTRKSDWDGDSIMAGEDLPLSCVIVEEGEGRVLYPPVAAEIKTQRNTDGEFLNDTLNIGFPFMLEKKLASFSLTSKCHLKSLLSGEPIDDVMSQPLITIVKCNYIKIYDILVPS